MHRDAVLALLREVQAGLKSAEAAAEHLSTTPYEELGFAKVDHHRALRSGMPEVVFASGKTAEQTAAILHRIAASGAPALATRADEAAFAATKTLLPEARYHAMARCITCGVITVAPRGSIAVVCAGTSDLPVAEEAAITAETFGTRVLRLHDVGVAGLHREAIAGGVTSIPGVGVGVQPGRKPRRTRAVVLGGVIVFDLRFEHRQRRRGRLGLESEGLEFKDRD